MKIFARQGKVFPLKLMVLTILFGVLLVPLILSPQKAQAASAQQLLPTDSSCVVINYVITNQWPGGFVATITITNRCSTPILACWTLEFTLTAGQHITQGWNASFSQSGSQVIATVCFTISPGGSVSIGFAGTWSGDNPPPDNYLLNGVPV
ncbi:MAG TPA: cellulose-binding domain-containing protein [Ktedonobacteraceae bacterium]|jgi:cellulase/cellobiase CelA1